MYKLSIFPGDAINTDHKSQNIISHSMKMISSLMIMHETQYLFKYVFAYLEQRQVQVEQLTFNL